MKLEKCKWINGEFVHAMAYDTPIIGYNTFNTNNLRLWSALPVFDVNQQKNVKSEDEYIRLIETRQRAEKITSVLYERAINQDAESQENLIK